MREDGYGYGQICHELGLHPSVLGNKYGHRKTERHMERNRHTNRKGDEFAEATARDVKSGWAKGHGVSTSGKSQGGNKGNADSLDSDNQRQIKGRARKRRWKGRQEKASGKGGGNGKK